MTPVESITAPFDAEAEVVSPARDAGAHPAPEILPRLFEPFLSTKQPDRGTGLGLWSVASIMHQAGGEVIVTSAVGTGSTFTPRLPERRPESDPAPLGSERELPRAEWGGDETILLVEDDTNLRTVIARMLARFGFNVLTAANGVEALTLLEGHGLPIDLLLTDIVMPELDGPELVQRLAARGITLPVVYMSGYSDQAVLRRITLSPTTQLLRKPFTLDVLLRTVRTILDQ